MKIYRKTWAKAHPGSTPRITDQWYVDFANRLLPVLNTSPFMEGLSSEEHARLACRLTWYLEDCINDNGDWNLFIRRHFQRSGNYLPFYSLTEKYVPDEINKEDIGYLLWAFRSPIDDEHRDIIDPLGGELMELASELYALMDSLFEQAPLTDSETAGWLPESTALLIEPEPIPELTPEIILPKYVDRFLSASGGEQLMYFKDYQELRPFFVKGLGWEDNDESLMPDLANETEFVLYANPKGLLIAPGVASFFSDKRNPLYKVEKAEKEAYELFCVPGYCPFDLIKYAMSRNLLRDAALPFPNGKQLLHENWDFISRRYLNEYYEGD